MGREPSRERLTETAAYMAERLCEGFRAHDDDRHADAVGAFFEVDRRQFAHLSDGRAREAATAFADALWAKDDVEGEFRADDGSVLVSELEASDWSIVARCFRRRAEIVGIDDAYVGRKTTSWRRHKVGGDYWTPMIEAQVYELRAALRSEEYPGKPSDGQSGYGPEPHRYALGIELHDMHTGRHWEQAVETMTPYFEFILLAHRSEGRFDRVPAAPA